MLGKATIQISGYTCIIISFFILDNINKPGLFLHGIIITIMPKINIPFSEFTFTYARSSGAGGQNVNKVNSKVTMYWDIWESPSCTQEVKERFIQRYSQYILDNGMVQLTSQKNRSQKANMDDCIAKLLSMLETVLSPPKIRRPTKPKRSAVLSRLNSKKKDSEKKRLRRKDY